MPPKTLTDKDLFVFAQAWRSFKGQPEIDYDKLAQLIGARNDKAAYKRLWDVKQKLFAMATDDDQTAAQGEAGSSAAAPAATGPEKKKRARATKKAVKDESKEDGAELPAGSPPKRRRLPNKAPQEENSEVENAGSDDESSEA